MKNICLFVASVATVGFSFAEEVNVDKDREAILAMVGEYEVNFLFMETMSLAKGYDKKVKIYSEDAFEKVFIVRNEPKLIELQHVLDAGGTIVKHWSQVWTFEDKEIVRYQKGSTWKVELLSDDAVKGTWSQLVTQTDDSPRYESYGKWVHDGASSTWQGGKTRRPLPRREYTKRKDYDYLVAVNRHTVTPDGWYHEQDNTKRVDREGELKTLSREVGFNSYLKSEHVDFSDVDSYWNETKHFWGDVKSFWRSIEAKSSEITIVSKVDELSVRDQFKIFLAKIETGEKVKSTDIVTLLDEYVNFIKRK